MHKLLIFDLDGTLCPIGKGMLPEDIALLKQLENSGRRIAVCSGKTTFYLCGFLRQIGLAAPILIGENGAVIQFGVDLPPMKYYICPCSPAALDQLSVVHDRIRVLCGNSVWFQPNDVMLTAFPKDPETDRRITDLLDQFPEEALSEVNVYHHVDSFDLVPKTISKYTGLSYLSMQEQIPSSEMIAFGDGINDVPMFEYADISIAVGDRLKDAADLHFDTIHEALEYVIREEL